MNFENLFEMDFYDEMMHNCEIDIDKLQYDGRRSYTESPKTQARRFFKGHSRGGEHGEHTDKMNCTRAASLACCLTLLAVARAEMSAFSPGLPFPGSGVASVHYAV